MDSNRVNDIGNNNVDSNNNNNNNNNNNEKSLYLWNAGLAVQEEENESEGRRWFGPAQRDFKTMENLGDRRLIDPDGNPDRDGNVLQDRNAISNQENEMLQRQRHPRAGSRGHVAQKNDGNPVVDMDMRNRPIFNAGQGQGGIDRAKFNFGPRQDFVLPGQMKNTRFMDSRGGQVFPGRAAPRRAADRRAPLGVGDDRAALDEANQRPAGEDGARIQREPRSVDDAVDIVDKAEQIFVDPAVGPTAFIDLQDGRGKAQQQQQQNRNQQQQKKFNSSTYHTDQSLGAEDFARYIQEKIEASEIFHGQAYKTEYDLTSFNRFIMNRIYMVDPGLGKRVVEKPIGSKKKDINEVLFQAVDTLNKNRIGTGLSLYTYDHFVEGIYRSEPASGSHYELYFINLDDSNGGAAQGFRGNGLQYQHHQQHLYTHSYVRVSIFRPFAPPQSVQHSVVNTGTEWINLILPLSGRVDTFRVFMDHFITVCIKQDRRVYLTVVYFGVKGLKEVKAIMSHTARTYRFKQMKLVTLNETFTRGRGLQIGALNWKGGADVLMFFCDVDIMFMAEFFERCRLNSEKGKRVYYPMVFSLYNPKIVYSLQDIPTPSLLEQLVLSKDTGFWRDFGYGMTCQYRSDFLKIKGFDEQITGWGGEDVALYQKFVKSSDYFVVRATDPAIFHLWHEKFCDPNLSAEQYRSCIRSKALNEASHSQMGLLAFKDEIDVHRSAKERNKLLLRNTVLGGAAAGAAGLDTKRKQQLQVVPNSLVRKPKV